MTTRRVLLCAPFAAASCKNPAEKMEILRMNLGNWHRMAVEFIPAEELPAELKERGIKRARRGIYELQGTQPVRVTASVFEFGAPAVAFEMAQKWRPEPKKLALHEGPYFVILQSDQAGPNKMGEFATQLEMALKQ